jgi:FMN reductase
MTMAVVVGNPKPASRTLDAATIVAERIVGTKPQVIIDVVTLGCGLLGFGDSGVLSAVEAVRECDLAVVASPTYKASFTGVLKTFLDQFPSGGLHGVTAFPLMLGAGLGHAMAPESALRPVLSELGASCPVRGLYLLETAYDQEEGWSDWLRDAQAHVPARTSP